MKRERGGEMGRGKAHLDLVDAEDSQKEAGIGFGGPDNHCEDVL